MSDLELRVPFHLADRLEQAVDSSGGERVAFGLVATAVTQQRRLLLLQELIEVPEDGYLPPAGHGARWSGSVTLKVLNRALERRLGVVIFHEHAFGNPVRLSGDDVRSGTEQLEIFERVLPGRSHGAVVVGRASSGGLFTIGGSPSTPASFQLRFIRDRLEDRASRPTELRGESPAEYARQLLVVGGQGQARLRQATVAVVGLGGGGSHVVQQLAHLGVGRIIGVDHDRADRTNRSRMIGLTEAAAKRQRPKTEVLKAVVKGIGLGSEFVPVPSQLPLPEAITALRAADVIVGCLDNFNARADLQQFAWRLLIPYVDIGLGIEPERRETSPDAWIGGNVHVLLPGSVCLWCTGFLTQARLDAETGGQGRSYFRSGPGAAQVVSLNGVLASQGVNEVLQLITGFAAREPGSRMLKFNGVGGTLAQWTISQNPACACCRDHLGAGDSEWSVA